MIKIITLTIALAISSLAFSQTKNKTQNIKVEKTILKEDPNKKEYSTNTKEEKEIGSKLPADFPTFIDTGNRKQDLANFHNAKQKWIKENPVRFQKIKHLNLNSQNKNYKTINDEK